jgi:hypothetical protein
MRRGIEPELDLYNDEHIKEQTAYDAFSHKKEREHLTYDQQMLNEAIAKAKELFTGYGFTLTARIKLRSRRTGRIYE